MSMQCVNWVRSPPASLIRSGHAIDHAVARAAEVGGNLLAPLERSVPGPRPGGRVVRRVGVGAPGVEATVLLDQRELLLGGEAIPFCIVSSLNEPVIVPSRLAPLSPKM